MIKTEAAYLFLTGLILLAIVSGVHMYTDGFNFIRLSMFIGILLLIAGLAIDASSIVGGSSLDIWRDHHEV